jgi:hypothetical protein
MEDRLHRALSELANRRSALTAQGFAGQLQEALFGRGLFQHVSNALCRKLTDIAGVENDIEQSLCVAAETRCTLEAITEALARPKVSTHRVESLRGKRVDACSIVVGCLTHVRAYIESLEAVREEYATQLQDVTGVSDCFGSAQTPTSGPPAAVLSDVAVTVLSHFIALRQAAEDALASLSATLRHNAGLLDCFGKEEQPPATDAFRSLESAYDQTVVAVADEAEAADAILAILGDTILNGVAALREVCPDAVAAIAGATAAAKAKLLVDMEWIDAELSHARTAAADIADSPIPCFNELCADEAVSARASGTFSRLLLSETHHDFWERPELVLQIPALIACFPELRSLALSTLGHSRHCLLPDAARAVLDGLSEHAGPECEDAAVRVLSAGLSLATARRALGVADDDADDMPRLWTDAAAFRTLLCLFPSLRLVCRSDGSVWAMTAPATETTGVATAIASLCQRLAPHAHLLSWPVLCAAADTVGSARELEAFCRSYDHGSGEQDFVTRLREACLDAPQCDPGAATALEHVCGTTTAEVVDGVLRSLEARVTAKPLSSPPPAASTPPPAASAPCPPAADASPTAALSPAPTPGVRQASWRRQKASPAVVPSAEPALSLQERSHVNHSDIFGAPRRGPMITPLSAKDCHRVSALMSESIHCGTTDVRAVAAFRVANPFIRQRFESRREELQLLIDSAGPFSSVPDVIQHEQPDVATPAQRFAACSTRTLTEKAAALDIATREELNERVLFHGTSPSAVPDIVAGGFDERVALGGEKSLFGAGTYASNAVCKALRYASAFPSVNRGCYDDVHRMLPDEAAATQLKATVGAVPRGYDVKPVFVARVLLGEACITEQPLRGIRRPPELAGSAIPGRRYDSIIGNGKRHKEFVVYDRAQIIPDLLVLVAVAQAQPGSTPPPKGARPTTPTAGPARRAAATPSPRPHVRTASPGAGTGPRQPLRF